MFDPQDHDRDTRPQVPDGDPAGDPPVVSRDNPPLPCGPIDILSLCALAAPNFALLAAINAGKTR